VSRSQENVLEQAKAFFEPQLAMLDLTVEQIKHQTLEELEQSLERVNASLANPTSFGILKINMTSEGIAVLTRSEAHLEIGILPILLERKKLILDRIKSLKGNKQIGNLRDLIENIPEEAFRLKLLQQLNNLESDSEQWRKQSEELDKALLQEQEMIRKAKAKVVTSKSKPSPKRTIEVLYSYSHKDEKLRNKLETQLSLLKQQGHVTNWHDRKIGAGKEWENEIDEHLNTADIILLLVSPDFIASNYCYSKETERALERHERGEAHVIPVIIRPVYWQGAPIGKLQALPTDGKPVTSWYNQDEAFFNVAEGIRKIVEEILNRV